MFLMCLTDSRCTLFHLGGGTKLQTPADSCRAVQEVVAARSSRRLKTMPVAGQKVAHSVLGTLDMKAGGTSRLLDYFVSRDSV